MRIVRFVRVLHGTGRAPLMTRRINRNRFFRRRLQRPLQSDRYQILPTAICAAIGNTEFEDVTLNLSKFQETRERHIKIGVLIRIERLLVPK